MDPQLTSLGRGSRSGRKSGLSRRAKCQNSKVVECPAPKKNNSELQNFISCALYPWSCRWTPSHLHSSGSPIYSFLLSWWFLNCECLPMSQAYFINRELKSWILLRSDLWDYMFTLSPFLAYASKDTVKNVKKRKIVSYWMFRSHQSAVRVKIQKWSQDVSIHSFGHSCLQRSIQIVKSRKGSIERSKTMRISVTTGD